MEGNPFNWTWTSSKSPGSDDAYVNPNNVTDDFHRSPRFRMAGLTGDGLDNVNDPPTATTSGKTDTNDCERHDESESSSSAVQKLVSDSTREEDSVQLINNNNPNVNDNSVVGEETVEHDNNKVSRATLTDTDNDESKDKKCKYCKARLSKLRWLERVKSRRRHSLRRRIIKTSTTRENAAAASSKGSQTSASLFEKAEMTQKELQSIAMILRFKCGRTSDNETFCKCVMHGKVRDCRCGEEDKCFEWVWDATNRPQATNLLENGNLALFHKDYSCGTAAVRGEMAMSQDQHFWEIKMTTPVYGTDMMVGIGTEDVDLNGKSNTFCSMLGNDADSWGLSYDGRIHHNKRKQEYCGRFGQGAIIGVHLDMWQGTLSFFKNRQPLGIAYTGLRGRSVYPMACSTAARSGMKIISSRSFPTSLQFMCCQTLRRIVPSHLSVLDTLAMPPGLRAFLANNMTWLLHALPPKARRLDNQEYICDICMPLKSVLEGLTDDEDSDEEKAGANINVFKLVESDCESDDEYDNVDDDDDDDDVSCYHHQSQSPGHADVYGGLPSRSRSLPSGSSFTHPIDSDFFSQMRNRYGIGSSRKRRRLDVTKHICHKAKQSRRKEGDEEEDDDDDDDGGCAECEKTGRIIEKGKKGDGLKEMLGHGMDEEEEEEEEEEDDEYELGSYNEAGPSSLKRKRL